MSFFGRLFGGGAPAPPVTSVVIDPELANQLTAAGVPLSDAVDAALREHLRAAANSANAAPHEEGERIPFWLARDEERSGELEDELRDRVIQRHESEDGNKD